MITDQTKEFIALFIPIINTEIKYLKLHNWHYHIINTIKKYGTINGFSTETYESLYKSYVKTPYKMSNRQNATSQIINMVLYIIFIKFIIFFY